MSEAGTREAGLLLDRLYREEFRRLFATVLRLVKDFDLAEDMLQEAFLVASQRWPGEGIPRNPASWLISVAHHKALDRFRRERRFEALDEQHLQLETALHVPDYDEETIADDRLRLIFTCCHPALERQTQVALTLREICGLTTEAIASAFLVQPAAMAQRLVRGKAKIRTAGIPYAVPGAAELPERLDAVLAVIYLVYNEGYRAASGAALAVPELAEEALRLGRLLVQLLPATEALGLLALMLLNEARRPARLDAAGDLVLLDDQDRSLWRRALIDEGLALLGQALARGEVGSYTLQAAISAEHARAARMEDTRWEQIVHCYDLLLQLTASPVVALNRAVALAQRDGPEAGLALLADLQNDKVLAHYHPLYVALAELQRRAGLPAAAREAYRKALALVQQEPERRHLQRRLASLDVQ